MMVNIRCTTHWLVHRLPKCTIIIWMRAGQVRPHAQNRSIWPINPLVRASFPILSLNLTLSAHSSSFPSPLPFSKTIMLSKLLTQYRPPIPIYHLKFTKLYSFFCKWMVSDSAVYFCDEATTQKAGHVAQPSEVLEFGTATGFSVTCALSCNRQWWKFRLDPRFWPKITPCPKILTQNCHSQSRRSATDFVSHQFSQMPMLTYFEAFSRDFQAS